MPYRESTLRLIQPIPAVFPAFGEPTVPLWLGMTLVVAISCFVLGLLVILLAWPLGRSKSATRSLGVFLAAAGMATAAVGIGIHVHRRARDRPPREFDEQPASDWPTERGGLERRGAVADPAEPRQGQILWRHQREGEAFLGSAAVSNDRLYAIGSTGSQGRIYEFDASTGEVRWAISPPGFRATFSSPVVYSGRLYCGEGVHDTRQARLVCVELRSKLASQIGWMFATEGHIESTPTVVDHRVFFGAGDDGWYILDDAPGSSEPLVVTHGEARRYEDVEGGFAIVGSKALVGLGLGRDGQALVSIDARDGHEVGRVRFDYPIFGSPSVAQGKAYVGMGRGDYVTPDAEAAGQIVCVDLERMNVEWTLPLPGSVLGSVAIVGEELVAACSNGSVYVVGLDGQQRSSLDTGAALAASPAVTQSMIFVVNFDGRLLAIDRHDMQIVWTTRLGAPGRYTSSPVVTAQGIVVGTPADGLFCIGQRKNEP